MIIILKRYVYLKRIINKIGLNRDCFLIKSFFMFIILVLYVSWKIKFNYLCWILYKVIFILNELFYCRLNIEYLKNICRIIIWNIKEF